MTVKPKRGIDHLVLTVRDLEAARRTYMRLGFTLTPRAVHPFGTGNSLVQMRGNFLELLTVVDPAKITPAGGDVFSFGAFNQEFLRRREGFSMLVFESGDAEADRAAFAKAGLRGYQPFRFERKAKLPDGGEATVAFSLAFASDPRIPEAAFFVCQQHAPQYFWKPEYQRHANGAVAVAEVVMVADDPPSLAEFFAGLQGKEAVTQQDGALQVVTARGRITVLPAGAAAERFPGLPLAAAPASPHFVGYRIAVRDLDGLRLRFDASDVQYRPMGGAIQLAPAIGYGCFIEFGQA
jgi:catechol 2,3-dioxygenase-like lactoylglutathione lyase family enzyme